MSGKPFLSKDAVSVGLIVRQPMFSSALVALTTEFPKPLGVVRLPSANTLSAPLVGHGVLSALFGSIRRIAQTSSFALGGLFTWLTAQLGMARFGRECRSTLPTNQRDFSDRRVNCCLGASHAQVTEPAECFEITRFVHSTNAIRDDVIYVQGLPVLFRRLAAVNADLVSFSNLTSDSGPVGTAREFPAPPSWVSCAPNPSFVMGRVEKEDAILAVTPSLVIWNGELGSATTCADDEVLRSGTDLREAGSCVVGVALPIESVSSPAAICSPALRRRARLGTRGLVRGQGHLYPANNTRNRYSIHWPRHTMIITRRRVFSLKRAGYTDEAAAEVLAMATQAVNVQPAPTNQPVVR